MEVRHEEHDREKEDAGEDTKNDAADLARTHLFNVRDAMTTANDDEQGEDAGSQGVVDRDDAQGPLQRVGAGVDEQLDRTHDDDSEATGDGWGNG